MARSIIDHLASVIRAPIASILAACLLAAAIVLIDRAPLEQTMGDAQRVLYLHVAVAWFSLLGFVAMATCGAIYLRSRRLRWDHWSLSICEVGWLCSTLTLVTGSLWAHAAWGTWWTWDPRLLTSLILWMFYSGNLLLRGGLDDVHQRARSAAVLSIVGLADVPLVVMATRWFRGIHPVSPEMEPAMQHALVAAMIGVTAVMVLLCLRRRAQLQMEAELIQLRMLTSEA